MTCGDDVTKLQLERHARYEAHLLGGLLLRSVTFEVRGASSFLFEVVTSTGVSIVEVNDLTHIVATSDANTLVTSPTRMCSFDSFRATVSNSDEQRSKSTRK